MQENTFNKNRKCISTSISYCILRIKIIYRTIFFYSIDYYNYYYFRFSRYFDDTNKIFSACMCVCVLVVEALAI